MLDLFQLLSSPDVNWWTVDYCDVFIRLSFWRHPFTAEHPLMRHCCRDTFLQIWWRNKLIYIFDSLRVSIFSAHVHFWVNCAFKIWDALTCLPPRRWTSSPPAPVRTWCWRRCGRGCCRRRHWSWWWWAEPCWCSAWASVVWRGGWCHSCVGGARRCTASKRCSSRIGTFWSRKAPTTGPVRCAWSARQPGRPKRTRPSADWHTCAPGCAARWFPPIPT